MTEPTYSWPYEVFSQWRLHNRDLHRFARAAARHHARHRGFRRGFGPGGPGFGAWFGGRRAGRGDIRAAILALLADQPMHGYQIIQELESRTNGEWRPSPGSVYPTLQQLEDEGLVETAQPEGGRRVFQLTEAGRTEAATIGTPPWEDVSGGVDDDLISLRDLFVQVAAGTWQLAQTGTSKQLAQAHEILRETKRRLYQLLAEEDSGPKN